jgi:antitoxin component of RelBE/YafQ-DinJ toxin-antitoxin module
MNELTEQKEVLNDTNPTITFKVPTADKNKITAKAAELGMSLSEWIRIKLLLEEPELNAIIRENKELKQQAKENLVKQDMRMINIPGLDAFNLLTTPEGVKLATQILDELKYEEDMC